MKTLYLHIGTHKTATTSIQQFCVDNMTALASKGLLYPKPPFHYHVKGRARNGLFLGGIYRDAQGVRDKSEEEARLTEGLNYIEENFKEYDNILLSDELLWINLYRNYHYALKRLKEHSDINGYRICMIIYLRRQDIFIDSWWNQIIKSYPPKTISFNDFIASYRYLDYLKILRAFESIIGPDNLIVRRFDDAVNNGGILNDFFSILGIELTDEYTFRDQKSNERLQGNSVTIKQAINSIEGLTLDENNFIWKVLTEVSNFSNYRCSEFSEEERAEFMKKYEEGNSVIAEHFIRDGKPLFSDDYHGYPKRTEDNPEFIKDVIRASFYASLELHRELAETKARLSEHERSITRLERSVTRLEQSMARLEKRSSKLEERTENMRHPVKWVTKKIAK